MPESTLVLLDVGAIQEYIFGSNHLAQNIGASEIVARVTSEWVVTTLHDDLKVATNVTWDETQGVIYVEHSLKDGLDVEMVYEGGGTAMLLCADKDVATRFIRAITLTALRRARGLELVAIQDTFEWTAASLARRHESLRGQLARRKLNRPLSTPLVGLGVTAGCVFTGLPAIGWDDDEKVVGREAAGKARAIGGNRKRIAAVVADKLRAEDRGKERLHRLLPQVRQRGFEFMYDFDEFGERGEMSYIAVIHADGNRMGQRFEGIADAFADPDSNGSYANANQDYVNAVRALSQAIKYKARQALNATVDYLLASLGPDFKFGGVVSTPLRERKTERVLLLPFRPIVFGGDDATFVSDGRLGLALAAYYLRALERGPLLPLIQDGHPAVGATPPWGGPLYARAGIAIVKTHFPFARAYDLADTLADHAKEEIGQLTIAGEETATVMDWHFSTTGVIQELADIRAQDYKVTKSQPALMRPVRLTAPHGRREWRTWDGFTDLVAAFEKDPWTERRNKLKALRQALLRGEDAVRQFLANYRITQLPPIAGQPDMQAAGWQSGYCGYLDALEALDFFASLEPVSATTEVT